MKLSIVTISYNQVRFVENCINSILSQDKGIVEYILVDPGSEDGTKNIIDKYVNSIDQVVLEPDCGPADGLNKGFNISSGDILGYINADDILLEGAARKILEFFERNPDIDVIVGNGYEIDDNGKRVRKIFSTRWGLLSYMYGCANAVQQATFFRRAAFIKAGGFNVNNRTSWDSELIVDMALCGARICRINDFLGEFRVYAESITGSGRLNEAALADHKRIVMKFGGRYKYAFDYIIFAIYFKALKYIIHPFQTAYKLYWRISMACKKVFFGRG